MHRVKSWARAKAHGSPVGLGNQTRPASSATAPPSANNGSTAPGLGPNGVVSEEPPKPGVAKRFGFTLRHIIFHSWLNILLVFVPVGIAVELTRQPAGVIFAMNAIAIIPLAGLLSHSTEVVAASLGDAIGALMNVTFGNAVELIIFIIALVKNEIRIVQASILGSILSNLLLILGMAFFLGGLRFREQIYNSTVTQMSACLLCLAVMSLLLPTAFHASFKNTANADENVLRVSRGVSVILLLVYALYILFQLKSHAYIYESTPQHILERETVPGPAAHYFDSSSDSDSDSSSSGSSSPSSTGARKTVKRVLRGKTPRADSNAETTTSNHEKQPEIDLTVGEETEVLRKSRRTQKKRPKNHKGSKRSRQAGDEEGESSLQAAPVTDTANADNSKQAEFSSHIDLEAQIAPVSSHPKPSMLQALRPSIPRNISQNVFTKPRESPDPLTFGNHSISLRPGEVPGRRTRSTPGPTNEIHPVITGDLPYFLPVALGGSQKTQTAGQEDEAAHHISKTSAVILLLASTALVAVCAEFMVDSINEVVQGNSGISEAFIGLILLPIVGNAAEHVTAVTVAVKNKMDLAIGVAVGCSIQIALFVTPLIVILGWILNKEMSLFFTLFETVSLFVSTFIVNFLVLDGRSNYLEGALLVAAYIIIAVAAYFYPSEEEMSAVGGGNDAALDEHAVTEAATRLMVRGLMNIIGI